MAHSRVDNQFYSARVHSHFEFGAERRQDSPRMDGAGISYLTGVRSGTDLAGENGSGAVLAPGNSRDKSLSSSPVLSEVVDFGRESVVFGTAFPSTAPVGVSAFAGMTPLG